MNSGGKGRFEDLFLSCICKKRHAVILDCMFIWVWIGDAHSVEIKSTSSCVCHCFQKNFSHILTTIQEIEMVPITFEVNFKHLQLESRFI